MSLSLTIADLSVSRCLGLDFPQLTKVNPQKWKLCTKRFIQISLRSVLLFECSANSALLTKVRKPMNAKI